MKCIICPKNFATLNKYIIHIEFSHALSNNFVCPFSGCYRRYNKKSSFRKHVNSKHCLAEKSQKLDEQVETNNASCNQNISKESKNFDTQKFPVINQTDIEEDDSKNKIRIFKELLNQKVHTFVAKLYTIKSMNRSTIQIIIDLVSEFTSTGLLDPLYEICLTSFQVSDNKSLNESIENMFKIIRDPFKSMNTEFKRIRFFENCNKFITPVSQILGITHVNKLKENKVTMNLKNNLCYFIPISKTLTLFLEQPGVFDSILTYQKKIAAVHNDDLLNVVNGTLWKKLNINLECQIVFPIVIYFDDFEILNPLGSHAGAYKIGAVYYTLSTIPPAYASKLENIFLALIFYSGDRTSFGNHKIFHKLINELNFLQEHGITVQINNKNINVRFILTSIIGDNLGLNSILGFFESFNAKHYCRICTCSKDEMKIGVQENQEKIRNVDSYTLDLQEKIGLKEECVWNNINSFHVYKNIYCDIMHDLFEGVHRYDMSLIINQLISKKYFDLDTLNFRIKYAAYNTNEKNIPPGFSIEQLQKDCIILSASEMLCLVRHFRFIVGDLVPSNDEIWKLYLTLYDITEILTSLHIQSKTLDYLKSLVEEHHQLFLKLSNSTLKPKFHFLLHYARVALNVGPPMLISCMRFEAKHAEFKNIAQNVRCRKNIPYTLALKNQFSVCSKFFASEGFTDTIEVGLQNYVEKKRFIPNYLQIDLDQYFSTKFYEINSIRYELTLIILLEYNDDMPIFCQIEDILVNKEDYKDVYFCCTLWYSSIFNTHYRAYEINKSERKKVYSVNEFKNEIPKIIHIIENGHFVSLE